MSVLQIPAPLVLPPWGVLNKNQREELGDQRAPNGWLAHAVMTQEERERDWQQWFRRSVNLIGEILWPVYDVPTRSWLGGSAARMNELTFTDLRLMKQLQELRELDKQPESRLRAPDCPTNLQLYKNEDIPVFSTFRSYNSTVDANMDSNIKAVCTDGVINKHLPITLAFKNVLQRPRPMQTALLFRVELFNFFNSCTSQTPSMLSGHCIQGVTGVAALLDANLSSGIATPASLEETLTNWAVDIGDRRVLAGVHYPSDSMCSWILFLLMCDKVFPHPYVRSRMAQAIRTRSLVLRKVMEARDAGWGEVYTPALNHLLELMA